MKTAISANNTINNRIKNLIPNDDWQIWNTRKIVNPIENCKTILQLIIPDKIAISEKEYLNSYFPP